MSVAGEAASAAPTVSALVQHSTANVTQGDRWAGGTKSLRISSRQRCLVKGKGR